MRLAGGKDIVQISELAIEAMVEQRDHKKSIDDPFDLFNVAAFLTRVNSAIVLYDQDILVDEVDGKIQAFMWMTLTYLEPWSSVPSGSDVQVYVGKKLRGSSTIVKMVKRYEAWCAEKGAMHCTLGISSGINVERTTKLYEKLGYQACSKQFIKEL